MATIQEANDILRGAEGKLRELIEKRLATQAYAEVAELAALAEGVANLLTREPNRPAHGNLSPTRRVAERQKAVMPRASGKPKRGDYPRFERDGDKLVKVGWSKKSRAEYEHRAPRSAVTAFSRHLCSRVSPGGTFAVEELLPVPDVVHDSDLPAYQVYMVLAWLRTAGAVDKKGRDGYVLRSTDLHAKHLEHLWDRLPTRGE